MASQTHLVLVVHFAVMGTAAVSLAECPQVHTLNGGANGLVYALVEYGGDLFAGGDFTSIGGQSISGLARWNGSNWLPTGVPWNNVRHLAVFDGELLVSTGAGYFARWNGTTWQTHNTPAGSIKAFTVYNDELIIGGQFIVNNVEIGNVLRWNLPTGQWQLIGAPGEFGTYSVKALTVHNGQLIAGGDFFVLNGKTSDGLARWNEAAGQWQPIAGGLNGGSNVYALGVYNNDLIVAGGFSHIGNVISRGVARWNSKSGWQSMAGGVSHYVDALTVYNGDLIIGGFFTSAGGTAMNNIARWNDSTNQWQSVGQGVTNCCSYGASVYTVAVSGGKLFGGGWFGFGESGPQRIIAWEDCTPCPADITGDQIVNVSDLLAVINAWGPCGRPCAADITGDNVVNVSDLLAVINAWGPCS